MAENVAQSEDTVTKPQDWDKAVAAAYLRLIGNSQEVSAEGAGIGRRTLIRYEKADWWHEACEEAADRWLSHLVEESRRTLLAGIKGGNASLALSILERVDRRLTPAANRHEVTGEGGGALEVAVTRRVVKAAAPSNRIAEHMNGANGNGRA